MKNSIVALSPLKTFDKPPISIDPPNELILIKQELNPLPKSCMQFLQVILLHTMKTIKKRCIVKSYLHKRLINSGIISLDCYSLTNSEIR